MITTASDIVVATKILAMGKSTEYTGKEARFRIETRTTCDGGMSTKMLANGTGFTVTIVDATDNSEGKLVFTINDVRIGITRYDLRYDYANVVDSGSVGTELLGFGSVKRIVDNNELAL